MACFEILWSIFASFSVFVLKWFAPTLGSIMKRLCTVLNFKKSCCSQYRICIKMWLEWMWQNIQRSADYKETLAKPKADSWQKIINALAFSLKFTLYEAFSPSIWCETLSGPADSLACVCLRDCVCTPWLNSTTNTEESSDSQVRLQAPCQDSGSLP